MRVTYDPQVDAAYIYLREIDSGGVKHTVPLDDLESNVESVGRLVLDFDEEGRLVGIEALDACEVLPPELLRDAEPPGGG